MARRTAAHRRPHSGTPKETLTPQLEAHRWENLRRVTKVQFEDGFVDAARSLFPAAAAKTGRVTIAPIGPVVECDTPQPLQTKEPP